MRSPSTLDRKYGLVHKSPDVRDHMLQFDRHNDQLTLIMPEEPKLAMPSSFTPVTIQGLPRVPSTMARSFRKFRGKPRDQGKQGSCTGFGSTNSQRTLLRFLQYKYQFTGSARFVYYNERDLEGTVDQDSGAEIRDAFKVMNTFGVCPEDSDPAWSLPYSDDLTLMKTKPPEACYKDAVLHRALQFAVVSQDRLSIAAAFDAGYMLVIGIAVHQSFESADTAKTGVVKMPGFFDRYLGGHCLALDEYDLGADMAGGENSWSDAWGDDGGFHIPMDYICSRNLTSEIWAFKLTSEYANAK